MALLGVFLATGGDGSAKETRRPTESSSIDGIGLMLLDLWGGRIGVVLMSSDLFRVRAGEVDRRP